MHIGHMCVPVKTSPIYKRIYTEGWPEPYMHTVYDRMYGDFPAKNTVYTPYICMYVWFWPSLYIGFPNCIKEGKVLGCKITLALCV